MKLTLLLKRRTLALTLFAATTLANTAWAGGTLVYCSEGSPTGFDVAQLTSWVEFNAVTYPLFDTLVAYKPGTTDLIPSLAQKWDVSPDGKTYTFHLRPKVAFHTTEYFKPTRNLQAEDVVFTFGRMIQKNHPSNVAYPAEYPYAVSMGFDGNVISLKKIDALTVEFKLKAVDAAFLTKLAVPFTAVHSVEYAQQLANAGQLANLHQKPIGTGPFVFSSYAKDETIRYNAHRSYWNADAVKLDKLVFSITKDAAARVQKLISGECDVLGAPNPADIAELQKNPALNVQQAQGFNIRYLSYNVEQADTKKREVRQALDMAINRQALVAAAYQGQGMVAINPFPPSLWGYNRSVTNAPTNLTQARALLTKAGYPKGLDIALWTPAHDVPAKIMAEMIQADWAKIGVKAKILSIESGEYLKRLKQGEHTAAFASKGGAYADPDVFMGVSLTCDSVNGSNFSRYCSKNYDELVHQALRTVNLAERTKLYEQAQILVKHDLPWTTLAHAALFQPLRKSVQGFTISPFSNVDFRYVSKSE
jgi:dipeptide transport system substrate-binding protein